MSTFSFQRLLTPLIHVLAWGLLALTLLLFQPMQGRVVLPPQYWVRQGALLVLWLASFYVTTRLSVPRLLLRGRTLYAVQNRLNQVAVVKLNERGTSGRVQRTITSPAFDVPSTVARSGRYLYLPNARFTTPATPATKVAPTLFASSTAAPPAPS